MIIDCIADLHGFHPELEGGDLLIVAGDLTANDKSYQYWEFICWLDEQNYGTKIVIGGNHDNYLQQFDPNFRSFVYLCDSGTEFEGLKIWGSPWTKTFEGMNPYCKAFTVDTEEELDQKWELIPDNIDILITHSPPYGILDRCNINLLHEERRLQGFKNAGSDSLYKISMKIQPKLHIFGHIHEGYGIFKVCESRQFINASHVNERYEPVNKPIRIKL